MMHKPLNILMADDDMDDIELVETAITSIEPQTTMHKVTNGKEAIDYLEKQKDHELPCLIILDYNMPELTGPEVLAFICRKKRYENIPKIVLSTSNTKAYINECMNNGATEYMVKPFDMINLNSLAMKLLKYCKDNSWII